MRDPERIPKTLTVIEAVWKKYPDMRLGQLLCNVSQAKELYHIWNLEEDELVEWLVAWASEYSKSTEDEIKIIMDGLKDN